MALHWTQLTANQLRILRAIWLRINTRYPGTLCPAWLASFERFAGDIGPRPPGAQTLARDDANRLFEPGNWHWTYLSVRPSVPRKVGPKELPLLLEMIELGTPVKEVAAAFGITQGGVRNILSRRGISASQRHDASAHRSRAKITPDIAANIRLRYGAGERVAALVKDYRISLRTVYDILNEHTWKADPLV